MSGMKKALALILALMMVMTFGTVLVSAVSVSDGEAVAEAAHRELEHTPLRGSQHHKAQQASCRECQGQRYSDLHYQGGCRQDWSDSSHGMELMELLGTERISGEGNCFGSGAHR